jgi:hypothetical protein
MREIINAAPGVVDLGTQDLSARQIAPQEEAIPQHLPKFFIFAQKGPVEDIDGLREQLQYGNGRIIIYGEETFVENSKYFNHQTHISNIVNAQGNSGMYVRLLPKDAGPKPSAILYLDVLPTIVDDYERNIDGSIKVDISGQPVIKGSGPGYRVKWVKKFHESHAEAEEFGGKDITTGTMIDPNTGTESTMYPIFEAQHNYFGEDGNWAGFRIWSINAENSVTINQKLIARERVYPFKFSIVRKNRKTLSPVVQSTIMGEKEIPVVFKDDVKDPNTLVDLFIGKRAVEDYQNIVDDRYTLEFGELGKFHVYKNNIDYLLGLFHAAEIPYLDNNSDFTSDPEDRYMFNFITGTDLQNAPYHSFIFSDTSDAIRLSRTTDIYLEGGSDGTMDHETHANLMSEYMERYADPNDELMDLAYHVESHVYDSGYPLDNKYDLIKIIAERPDTFVVLSPHDVEGPELTQGEEFSIAQSLRARLELYPESQYFGTYVFRGMIVGNSGLVRNSQVKTRVPFTFEVAKKSARYMGAGHGKWKNGFNFDGYPGSRIEDLYDPNIRFVADSVRNRLWDVGLNFVARYNRRQFYFPALKTCYDNDTSVLTSYLTACAIIQLHKIAWKVQRTFSGVSGLTMDQFNDRVNQMVNAEVQGKFDNRYIIVPRCHFTEMDQVRNYSWTLPIDIYAPGMKTVMTTYVVAKRIEDYVEGE